MLELSPIRTLHIGCKFQLSISYDNEDDWYSYSIVFNTLVVTYLNGNNTLRTELVR